MPNTFVDRVLSRIQGLTIREYTFKHWKVPDKPTEEAIGLLPIGGADPKKVLARVMDVDRYVGNIGYVSECRAVPDPRFVPPQKVRFYQRVKIPVLGEVHHELVLELAGTLGGYEVASWTLLEAETAALSTKSAIRSQTNEGGWFCQPGVVGYALSSVPRREDVGFLKWKALTAGADVAASKVIRDNIEGMARWAARAG